ncbi:EAL domain-containing protein [Paraburkholderia phenazinium]|uniref:EAL domain-containing protein n=1 Tax=Paraburkholderia phenazinium TaxID=60549 RepID=UPI001ABB7C4E|nr:EAL domain-containing protein [Paraburkholderia phenazinium]
MKKTGSPQAVIGLMLTTLSLVVMTGWLTHRPAWVQVQTEFKGMVFNCALCFFAIGVAVMLPASNRAGRVATGWAVITLTGLVLLQNAVDINLPIDWRQLHEWLGDANPNPGRIQINTGVGLMLCGTALVLIESTPSRLRDAFVQIAILGAMVTGLAGLMGSSWRFDLIYPSLRWPHMAVLSALAMMLAAAGLWAVRVRTGGARVRYQLREDNRIGVIGAVILAVTGLTIGFAALSAQVTMLEQTLSDKLGPMLENRTLLFHDTVGSSLDKAEQAAQRISAIHFPSQFDQGQYDAATIVQLRESMQSLYASGFSGVAFLDTHNRELLREGVFVETPPIQVDLGMNTPVTLLWGDAYYLNSRIKIFNNGTWIGTFVSERPLPDLTERFFNARHIGQTGEIGLCFDGGKTRLSCFPQSPNERNVVYASRKGTNGKPTAMSLAVAGKEGQRIGHDYRDKNTLAAYRPLAPGLGLVVKQDTEELFQPIREQVQWTLPLLLLFVGAGALALRYQVKAIATQLLRSEADARENEQRIGAIFDNVAEGIITLDETGIIESFNSAAAVIFGYAQHEAIGQNVQILLPPNMSQWCYLQRATQHITTELSGRRKNGKTFPMEFSTSEIRFDSRRLVTVIARDITGKKQAEAALFAEKERLLVTLGSIGDAVIATDTEGRVTYMNPIAESITGWRNEEALGQKSQMVFEIVDERTNEPALNPVEIVLKQEKPAGLAENTVLVSRSSARFAIEDSAAPIRNRSGEIIGVVLVFHDVSEARKMAALMSHQASHDDLTGLINRREFERHLKVSLQPEAGTNTEHTLLCMDLDRFKIVNDTSGHEAGDELLRQLGSLLQAQLRRSDRLARLGGDEFSVLLTNCSTGPALRVAEKLLRVVSEFRFVWKEKAFPVGISIGLVTYTNTGITPPEVLRMGDAACYVAKDKGRNRVQVYTSDDNTLVRREGEAGLLGRIRQAQDENGFVLYAQRIVSLKKFPCADSRNGDHFELLLRMKENDRVVPPMAFIPVAERYGLMTELDRWVIKAAFSSYVDWNARSRAPATYAINLSGASINDENFLAFVLEQFEQYAVPPDRICFEITETSAIANLNRAAVLIEKLRSIGCRFSLDDFGTGMSSFAYLKHLPVDYLKIDGAFVKDMVVDPISFAMVESINHIGHVMGIRTIAEFVESDALVLALRKVGVDFAQGYGIEKPMPLDHVLRERHADLDREEAHVVRSGVEVRGE